MASALEKEWNSYFIQLNDTEKKSVLLLLKTFLNRRQPSSERISLEQYNLEIDEVLSEIEDGNYISQEEMEKRNLG